MRHIFSESEGRWLWRCDNEGCGRIGLWGEGWSRHGTEEDVDWVVCSETCLLEKSPEWDGVFLDAPKPKAKRGRKPKEARS